MAFALPLATTTARTPERGKSDAERRTLAARVSEVLKHPAADAGTSERSKPRSRRLTLIPQAIPAKEKPMGTLPSELGALSTSRLLRGKARRDKATLLTR
jgi:hypothetical protein